MAHKKTESEIEKFWSFFQEKPSVAFVAEKCGISETTIRRYRDKEHWLDRLKKIREKAAQKADANAATKLAENLRILTAAKKVYAASLYGKAEIICPDCGHRFVHPVPKAEPSFRDIDTIIRLEEMLIGRPDSRQDISGLGEMTPAERLCAHSGNGESRQIIRALVADRQRRQAKVNTL